MRSKVRRIFTIAPQDRKVGSTHRLAGAAQVVLCPPRPPTQVTLVALFVECESVPLRR
eukprot:COSAG05_NODE_19655_length_289_cov_1.084211_1_plen_57_part_01